MRETYIARRGVTPINFWPIKTVNNNSRSNITLSSQMVKCDCAKCQRSGMGYLGQNNIFIMPREQNLTRHERRIKSKNQMGFFWFFLIAYVGLVSWSVAFTILIFYACAAIVLKLAGFDWDKIGHMLFVELDPIHLIWQGLSTNPITGHLFREIDKLTGGLFTRLDQVTTLGGRALRGDAISTGELIGDILFLAQIWSVGLVGGGSTEAWVRFGTDALKRGVLGQTPLGRAILNIATPSLNAYLTGGDLGDTVQDALVREIRITGTQELIRSSPLGQSLFGRYLAGLGIMEATTVITGESQSDVLNQFAEDFTKGTAKTEIAKQINLPGGDGLANQIVEGGYPPRFDQMVENGQNYSAELLENAWNQIKNAPQGIIDAITNININISLGNLTIPKIEIDPFVVDIPKFGLGMPDIALPQLSVPKIEIPKPELPSSYAEWEALYCKISFLVNKKNVCAKYRKKVLVGGRWMWVYLLEDGQIYWTFEEISYGINYAFLGMLAIGGLTLVGGKDGQAS